MVTYRHPPPSGIRRVIWMWWIRIESTFGLAMMENWEKALIYGTFLFITLLFWISFLTYAPGHLAYLSRRFSYYVFEDESVNVGLLIWEWLAEQARRGWKGAKGVSESGGAGIEEMRRTSGAGGGKAEL